MESTATRRRRGRAWMWMIGLLVPTLIAVMIAGRFRPSNLLARHWRAQLHTLSDEEVAVHLRQIAELGDAGIAVLVEAVGSPRTIVAVSACATLDERIDDWARLPSDEAVGKVAAVAKQLAARAGNWNGASQRMAGELTMRILSWPTARESEIAARLVADCEKVLRLTGGGLPGETRIARGPSVAERVERDVSRQVSAKASLTDEDAMSVSHLPGGDLPVDAVELPPLPPSLFGPPQPRPVGDDQPDLVPPFGKQLPRVMFPENETADPHPDPELPTLDVTPPAEPRTLGPSGGDSPASASIRPASAVQAEPSEDLPLEITLMHRLVDEDPQVVQQAVDQLRARGFRNVDFALAGKMVSPLPSIRQRVVEELVSQSTMAGRWLIWFSYDRDPRVRKSVISMMATTRDPQVHQRLREMLTKETDDDVRVQLEKVTLSSASRHGLR